MSNEIFIGNLNVDYNQDRLTEVFKQCDGFTEMTFPSSVRRPARFAFCTFATAEDAANAAEAMNGEEFDGAAMSVAVRYNEEQRANAQSGRRARRHVAEVGPTSNVMTYSRGLPASVTEEELAQLYATIGITAKEIRIVKSSFRTHVFTEFASAADQQKAIAELHEVEFKGRKFFIEASTSTGKKDNAQ